ncbi:MAG: hypothetical protein QOF33_2340 [Thermomicrobiales bacterium]|nr:hypothetical protein [Thermomicrobiales bacterium]MEA2528355.1 hypothetical protein [Thermomicrobiales bacterium]MEA2529358.1 hypothetical protein [Thermomicrobiales bacterium]MEA2584255.1 hypothetical protein [Thermomicrobiales bacterium]MEA2597738.1 hypothetical protein [Thermomicrobiales bacterium]
MDAIELGAPAFAWRDHSRYVEIVPVRTGWLVVWGRYEDMGRRRLTLGNRVYRDLVGVRRRLVDAVIELTGNRQEAIDALALLDRRGLPEHTPQDLPSPL